MNLRNKGQQKQCRACMCTKMPTQKFQSLKDRVLGMEISRIFMILIPELDIQQDDEDFPQHICFGCVIKLKNAYQFREMCLKNDQMYQERYLKKVNSLQNAAEIFSINSSYLDPLNSEEDDAHLSEMLPSSKADQQKFDIAVSVDNCFSNQSSSPTDMVKEISSKKKYACTECDKAFMYYAQLYKHKIVHAKKIRCKYANCGKEFTSRALLLQHKTMHTEKECYQCPHCPKTFRRQAYLTKHQSTHSSEKNHICEICGSAFKRSYSLADHLEIHASGGIRSCKCDQCDSAFTTKKQLRHHKRIHNTNYHNCEFCSRKFKDKSDLNRHLRTHLGNKIWECSNCKQRFMYRTELYVHQVDCPLKNPVENVDSKSIEKKKEYLNVQNNQEDFLDLESSLVKSEYV